jgi:HSP20 family protein
MGRWNPLNDLMSLQDQMNRLFEEASQRRANEATVGDEVESADWVPAANVYERDGAYVVSLDVPGIDRTKLDISINEDRLVVKGWRDAAADNNHREECPKGKFLRTFSVPGSVDQQAINAEYKDGVLRVFLPKAAERKPQRVEIKVT